MVDLSDIGLNYTPDLLEGAFASLDSEDIGVGLKEYSHLRKACGLLHFLSKRCKRCGTVLL